MNDKPIPPTSKTVAEQQEEYRARIADGMWPDANVEDRLRLLAEIERLKRENAEFTSAIVTEALAKDRLRAIVAEQQRNCSCPYGDCSTCEKAKAALSGDPNSADETTAKPTDSELYSSSELFRHIWVCPMGWIGDKLIYGPGYTSADMKPWLVKLRRLVGFEHPEGTPLEQPEKADGSP